MLNNALRRLCLHPHLFHKVEQGDKDFQELVELTGNVASIAVVIGEETYLVLRIRGCKYHPEYFSRRFLRIINA